MIERLSIAGLAPSGDYRGGYYTRIYETEQDKSILIKEVKSIWKPGLIVEDYDADLFCREVGGSLTLFLDPRYGMARFIPPTRLAWGVNLSGRERGFIIMKKVTGDKIDYAWNIDTEVATALDELLASAIAMGIDNLNLEMGERKIPDIINRPGFTNIIIGNTDVNQRVQPYIIDTYPASLGKDDSRETWDKALKVLGSRSNGFWYDRTRRALENFFQTPQLRKLKITHPKNNPARRLPKYGNQ